MNLASPRYLFREKALPKTKVKLLDFQSHEMVTTFKKAPSVNQRSLRGSVERVKSNKIISVNKKDSSEKNQNMSYDMEQLRIDMEQIKLDFNQFYKIVMKQLEDQDMRLQVLEEFCK